MKKLNKYIMFFAAAAMALASCSKEELNTTEPEGQEVPGTIKVRFGTETPITKAVSTTDDANFSSSWITGKDEIGVTIYSNATPLESNVYAKWDGDAFEAEFEGSYQPATTYQFKGVYPYSETGSVDFGNTRDQIYNAQSGKYDIMVSKTISATLPAKKTLILPMDRQTATVYFHLKSSFDEEVKSVTLVTDEGKPIAAVSATLDTENGFVPTTTGDNCNFITLNIKNDESKVMHTTDMQFWFNVLPVEGTSLKLIVESENRTFTMNKKANTTTWEAGHLYTTVLEGIPSEKWVEKAGEPEPVVVNYSLSSTGWSNDTKYTELVLDDNLKVTAAGGGNTGKFYTTDNTWRFYANESATATFSLEQGYTFKKAKITYAVKDNGKMTFNDEKVDSEKELQVDGLSEFSIGTTSTSGSKGKVLITNIYVEYVAGSEPFDPLNPSYAITVKSGIQNGTVKAINADSETITYAKAGDAVTLSAIPETGYALVAGSLKATNSVTGEEIVFTTGTTFTMPAANVVIEAEFTELPKYAVNLVQTTGGTISSDIEQAWEGQTVTLLNEITEGYTFKSWDVKYGPENTQITVTDNKFTMPAAAVTASANFIPSLTVTPMSPTKKDSPAGSWNFTVTTAATDWEVSVPDNQDWASVEKAEGGFTLTYTANEKETETTEDRSVVITVSSEQAEKIGDNAIKITFSQSGKEYIAPGTGYNLVTNTSDLYAGMTIVLGCAANNKVAGTISSDFLTSADANIENGVLTSNNAVEFTLGGVEGAWTLTSTEGMLGATAVKKLSYSATDRTKTWTISIANTGVATITSTNENYGIIKYNTSSPRFLNYAASTTIGMAAIQIYAKEDGLSNRNLAFTSTSDTKDIKNGTSVDVLGLNGVADGTKTYDSSDKTVATITNNGKITLLGEGTTKISVSIPENETYRAGYAEYTLTVIDNRTACADPTASPASGEVEKGATVTLSCSTANSTIYYREGTTGDFSQYASPITIDAAKTIQAYATADGYKQSSINEFNYTVSGGSKDIIVLNEEFDNNQSTDSNTAITSSTFTNFNGATSKAYKSQYGGIKLGASKDTGYITSKSLDLSKPFTISINVLKYGTDTGKVTVEVGNQKQEITPTDTDTKSELDFEAATSSSTVKISTTSKRAYIDNVVITRHD